MRSAKVLFGIMFVVTVFYIAYAQVESSIEVDGKFFTKSELKNQAEELIRNADNIELRRKVNIVFAAGDVYEKEANLQKSLELYEKALEINAWNLEYQLRLARLLIPSNRKGEAISKARLVFNYAEDEALIQEAGALLFSLGEEIPIQRPDLKVDDNIEIVLIPLGDHLNTRLMDDLRYDLEKKMGIRFSISSKAKGIGKFDRTKVKPYVNSVYEEVKETLPTQNFNILLNELKLNIPDLELFENKIKFIYAFFDKFGKKGEEAKENFDKNLEEAGRFGQYDTARLLRELRSEFPRETKARIKGFLAVTGEDIYEDESNFRFGAALLGYGIISYHRFTAAFNHENQNRMRLGERILKQAVSSSFFVLGIPRCTNPDCIRAYPHSLLEHDEKPVGICPVCMERLNNYKDKDKNK